MAKWRHQNRTVEVDWGKYKKTYTNYFKNDGHLRSWMNLMKEKGAVSVKDITKEEVIGYIYDLKLLAENELEKLGISIDHTKQTTSQSSYYIYTEVGVIRISDHHNEKSFKKCVTGMTVPIKKKVAIKIIEHLKTLKK